MFVSFVHLRARLFEEQRANKKEQQRERRGKTPTAELKVKIEGDSQTMGGGRNKGTGQDAWGWIRWIQN